MIQYFSPEYYSHFGLVKNLALLASFMTMGLVVWSVVACVLDGNNSRQVLMAVETAGLVQFTYFSLIGVGELNQMFVAMAQGLKYSCGFDVMLMDDRQTTERILLGIDIQSAELMNNVNVSLVGVIVFFVVGIVLMIVSKVKKPSIKQK